MLFKRDATGRHLGTCHQKLELISSEGTERLPDSAEKNAVAGAHPPRRNTAKDPEINTSFRTER